MALPLTNELLSPEELAERLGVSLRMVREMYYTERWPHLRLNKRTVRFTEDHYQQIIAMSERKPASVLQGASTAGKASELAELLSRKRSA